jgi:hypothetical protein
MSNLGEVETERMTLVARTGLLSLLEAVVLNSERQPQI